MRHALNLQNVRPMPPKPCTLGLMTAATARAMTSSLPGKFLRTCQCGGSRRAQSGHLDHSATWPSRIFRFTTGFGSIESRVIRLLGTRGMQTLTPRQSLPLGDSADCVGHSRTCSAAGRRRMAWLLEPPPQRRIRQSRCRHPAIASNVSLQRNPPLDVRRFRTFDREKARESVTSHRIAEIAEHV
jgi:hypothetical protein